MNTKYMPTLSSKGWVDSPQDKLSFLINYYILSDAEQSLIYRGSVINLPTTYFKYINEPEQMAIAVKSDLESLLSRHFDVVEVRTYAKELDNAKKYGIGIFAAIVENGVKYTAYSAVTMTNNNSREIINFNNYGDYASYLETL